MMSRLVRVFLLTLLGAFTVGAAGDPQPPQAPPGDAPASEAPAAAAVPAGQAAAPVPEIEEFVPSEKVSADDAVAFPTDI
jgi:hypothetical protein